MKKGEFEICVYVNRERTKSDKKKVNGWLFNLTVNGTVYNFGVQKTGLSAYRIAEYSVTELSTGFIAARDLTDRRSIQDQIQAIIDRNVNFEQIVESVRLKQAGQK